MSDEKPQRKLEPNLLLPHTSREPHSLFPIPLSMHQKFSDVFRGYRKRPVTETD